MGVPAGNFIWGPHVVGASRAPVQLGDQGLLPSRYPLFGLGAVTGPREGLLCKRHGFGPDLGQVSRVGGALCEQVTFVVRPITIVATQLYEATMRESNWGPIGAPPQGREKHGHPSSRATCMPQGVPRRAIKTPRGGGPCGGAPWVRISVAPLQAGS